MLAFQRQLIDYGFMKNVLRQQELHKSFSETEHGQKLSGDIRYKKYNLSGMPNEQWERMLGRDVNNLEHMSLTHGIGVAFIRHSEQYQPDLLTDEEKETLLLTAMIHDWGEAIRGDVSYSDKTNEEETQEEHDFLTVMNSVGYGAFTPEDMLKAKEITFDHESSKLGRMFFAIEQLGYMRTALTAATIVYEQSQPDNSTDGLVWLSADVLGNIMRSEKIIQASLEYDAVRAAIADHEVEIDTAFETVVRRPLVFENYGEKQDEKYLRFMSARADWNQYKKIGRA